VIRAIVSDAQTSYAQAIGVMLRNERYESDELRELELDLLRSFALIPIPGNRSSIHDGLAGARLDEEPWRSWMDSMAALAEWELPQSVAEPAPEQDEPRDGKPLAARFHERECLDACLGRLSLQRLLAYEIATAAPLRDQVEAFVRIGDWEGRERALERYERAIEMLEEAGAQTLIDELFAPKTPIVLPTFVPNPLITDSTASTGYIDAAFEITDYGKSRRVEILDTTTNATNDEKARLVQLIQNSRFRPRLTDGEFARASRVVLRYYLTE
jgi:hypothetical protein